MELYACYRGDFFCAAHVRLGGWVSWREQKNGCRSSDRTFTIMFIKLRAQLLSNYIRYLHRTQTSRAQNLLQQQQSQPEIATRPCMQIVNTHTHTENYTTQNTRKQQQQQQQREQVRTNRIPRTLDAPCAIQAIYCVPAPELLSKRSARRDFPPARADIHSVTDVFPSPSHSRWLASSLARTTAQHKCVVPCLASILTARYYIVISDNGTRVGIVWVCVCVWASGLNAHTSTRFSSR